MKEITMENIISAEKTDKEIIIRFETEGAKYTYRKSIVKTDGTENTEALELYKIAKEQTSLKKSVKSYRIKGITSFGVFALTLLLTYVSNLKLYRDGFDRGYSSGIRADEQMLDLKTGEVVDVIDEEYIEKQKDLGDEDAGKNAVVGCFSGIAASYSVAAFLYAEEKNKELKKKRK